MQYCFREVSRDYSPRCHAHEWNDLELMMPCGKYLQKALFIPILIIIR